MDMYSLFVRARVHGVCVCVCVRERERERERVCAHTRAWACVDGGDVHRIWVALCGGGGVYMCLCGEREKDSEIECGSCWTPSV
jgi:hypothetical protein